MSPLSTALQHQHRFGALCIYLSYCLNPSTLEMAPCALCPPDSPARAILRRPKTLQPVCRKCFFEVFETEIHNTIMGFGQAEESSSTADGKGKGKMLFKRGEKVAIGASGGKGELVYCSVERPAGVARTAEPNLGAPKALVQGHFCCSRRPASRTDTTSRRLDCAGSHHDVAERAIRLRTGPLPSLDRRGYLWLPRCFVGCALRVLQHVYS